MPKTTAPDEVSRVVRSWGEGDIGPMNGAVGQGVTDAVFNLIRTEPGVTSICDLGCGGGYLAGRLGEAGYAVEGVDGSERLIAIANEHHASARVHFREGLFGEELARELARDHQFDLVVSVDVIEHLYRPRTLIETAALLLKPGGRLILCTPYHGYLKNLAIAALGRWDSHHGVHWDGGHVKFFSPATLAESVEGYFELERFVYYGRWPGFWKNMILVATKRA
jgi:SAM-dependent methyltransferase